MLSEPNEEASRSPKSPHGPPLRTWVGDDDSESIDSQTLNVSEEGDSAENSEPILHYQDVPWCDWGAYYQKCPFPLVFGKNVKPLGLIGPRGFVWQKVGFTIMGKFAYPQVWFALT